MGLFRRFNFSSQQATSTSTMDTPLPEPSLYTVKAILILDNDGNRLIAKYYDESFPSTKEQKAFEKNLFNKTHRANAEIIMLDGFTCVYRSNVDLFFYVVGSAQENELILHSVLNCFYDAISHLLKKNVEKRALLDNMDGVFLAVDEVCDHGIILESDPIAIANRISIRSDDLQLGDNSMAAHIKSKLQVGEVLQSAKEQIKWSLLK